MRGRFAVKRRGVAHAARVVEEWWCLRSEGRGLCEAGGGQGQGWRRQGRSAFATPGTPAALMMRSVQLPPAALEPQPCSFTPTLPGLLFAFVHSQRSRRAGFG